MADEWEEEETAKPVGGQQKYGNNNNYAKKTTDDDDWAGSGNNNNNDGWSNGGTKQKEDDWGSGGGAKKKDDDDWGTGGGNDDAWGSGGNTQSNGGGGRSGGGGGRSGGGGGYGGGGGGGRQRTNWICLQSSCGQSNFGHRQECFKCHEPKGDAVDVPADENSRPPPRQRTNWICTQSSCGQTNFGHRTDCFKCSEPKGDAVDIPADENSRGGGGRGNDWMCTDSSCGLKNFANRTECFKCKTPKGDAKDAPSSSSGGGGGGWGSKGNDDGWGSSGGARTSNGNSGDGDDKKRKNDWTCPAEGCGNSNFGFRTECQKCSEPRPATANGGGDFQSEKPREFYIPPEIDESELFTKGISKGINFNKFKDIPVKVTGDNKPPQCTTFADAGLDPFLLDIIKKCDYNEPTPIQKTSIPIIMKGRDLMACAQTGSGKTAAFLLPIINTLLTDNHPLEPNNPQVLIMAPTRELAKQIHFEAKKFSKDSILKSIVIYGGTATRNESTQLGSGFHILVATPGRLIDYAEKGMIYFNSLRFLVLDEADRMLDMGFKSAIEKILENPTMSSPEKRRTLMFSATFPEDIQRLAGKYLREYLFVTIGIVGGASSDVEQIIHQCSRFDKRKKLMEILDADDPKGTMVFVETKRNADFLASFLSESKHRTTSIHGDRLQRQREEALNDFKSGKMKVLIATSVAARGLDIPDVRHVINFDLPKGIDDYVHRIGRTGRVGNQGKATSFYDAEQDAPLADELVKILKQANQNVPDFLATGGTGGGGDYQQKAFGGRDIRNAAAAPAAHGGGGDDEDW